MVSKKTWDIMNVSLVVIILLLILNLIGVTLPNVGTAIYVVDPAEHICGVETLDGEFVQMGDLDRCCLEARKQLKCSVEIKSLNVGETSWVCKTSQSIPMHRLNNKALYYCQGLEIWT